jgi:hypothetical protein
VFPVLTEAVEVTVVNCWLGMSCGGGVVTTEAVGLVWGVVVGVVLVLVFVVTTTGLGVGSVTVGRAVVVVLVRVVVVEVSSPPPKRLVNQPNGSSVVVGTLCLATNSWYWSPLRAARASNREGLKCIAHARRKVGRNEKECDKNASFILFQREQLKGILWPRVVVVRIREWERSASFIGHVAPID